MKYHYTFLLFILSFVTSIQAQKSINGTLKDSINQKPVLFATISFNNTSGVISNENGTFQMYLKRSTNIKDSLFISCLGYESRRISAEKFTDSIIFLKPQSIELQKIMLSNKNYSVEEIIEKTKEQLPTNYNSNLSKSKLFYRESYLGHVLKNDVILDKSTIPEINQRSIDSLIRIIPKNTHDYTEILGTLYKKTTPNDTLKLDIIKASHLYDKNNQVTFENLEKKTNTILRKHIKRDSYFKIKSGLFGTKEDIDSSFFQNPEAKKADALFEEQKKQEAKKKRNFLKYRKQTISNLEKGSFAFEDSYLNFLEKSGRYEFELLGSMLLNENFVYKITFTPKRRSDFEGTLYINADDFAIVRVDYKNVKAIKNFRLLGVSYNEYLKKGTLIYKKNDANSYALKYAELEQGSKFGIKRPLTIIEKNKHVKGRRKQNEISGDIDFIISNTTKKELVVFENESITEQAFTSFIEEANVQPTYLPQYDPEFWKGHNVIEPNQAIKDFKSIE